jgi:hypothetical protein
MDTPGGLWKTVDGRLHVLVALLCCIAMILAGVLVFVAHLGGCSMRTLRLLKSCAYAALFAGASLGFSGCGTSTSLLGSGAGFAPADGANSEVPATVRADWKMVALEQLHGAPDGVRSQIVEQVARDGVQHGLILRADPGTYDYKLRGYLLAETAKSQVKVIYVWDVLDATGARVSRVSGEEIVAAGKSTADRWASVPRGVLAMVAEKAVAALGQAVTKARGAGSDTGGAPSVVPVAAGGQPSLALR